VLIKYMLVHRYVEHPLEQFVDLLTLTNVSIMLLEDTYAGYYLHGKSLMTHADTSLMELNVQMRKEMEMQVRKRARRAEGWSTGRAGRLMAVHGAGDGGGTPTLIRHLPSGSWLMAVHGAGDGGGTPTLIRHLPSGSWLSLVYTLCPKCHYGGTSPAVGAN
jgi:hypothetical protein